MSEKSLLDITNRLESIDWRSGAGSQKHNQKMLEQIESEAKTLEKKYEKRIEKIHPANQKSAMNLIHYLALRNQDIRELQNTLGQLGISRLGRAEGQIDTAGGSVLCQYTGG